jgi:hypothetical protein
MGSLVEIKLKSEVKSARIERDAKTGHGIAVYRAGGWIMFRRRETKSKNGRIAASLPPSSIFAPAATSPTPTGQRSRQLHRTYSRREGG